MPITINEVIDFCRKKNVQVDAINFQVGSLIIDQTGVCGRGSAVILAEGGQVPPIESDETILETVVTFIVHPAEGEPYLQNREEFEQLLQT